MTIQSGSKEYDSEGYQLRWGPDGLEIEATDYHAGVLRLKWSELQQFARTAGRKAPSPPIKEERSLTPRMRMKRKKYEKRGAC